MARGQAERLMPLLGAILADAGADWPDLHRIGVGTGPGNFTGVRISIAAARGLSLALGIPATGVPVLEALAHGATRPVLCTLDARRGQVHAQSFGTPADFGPILTDPADIVIDAPGLTCLGDGAAALAERLGGVVAAPAFGPGEAVARIAAQSPATADRRPSPIYLRAPDAAPARDTGPAILP